MQFRSNQLVVIVGASAEAERLRRLMVRTGTPHAGLTGSVRGLRRELVAGSCCEIVLCIATDECTLERHGRHIASLIDDRASFEGSLSCVGLLEGEELTAAAGTLGCDVYVSGASRAFKAMDALANHGRRRPAARRSGALLRHAGQPGRNDVEMSRSMDRLGGRRADRAFDVADRLPPHVWDA